MRLYYLADENGNLSKYFSGHFPSVRTLEDYIISSYEEVSSGSFTHKLFKSDYPNLSLKSILILKPKEVFSHEFPGDVPESCPSCEGEGYYSYEHDPSPPGVGLPPGTMTEWEPCPNCVGNSICPVCSFPLDENDYCNECERNV